jgi:hypothetical protein
VSERQRRVGSSPGLVAQGELLERHPIVSREGLPACGGLLHDVGVGDAGQLLFDLLADLGAEEVVGRERSWRETEERGGEERREVGSSPLGALGSFSFFFFPAAAPALPLPLAPLEEEEVAKDLPSLPKPCEGVYCAISLVCLSLSPWAWRSYFSFSAGDRVLHFSPATFESSPKLSSGRAAFRVARYCVRGWVRR